MDEAENQARDLGQQAGEASRGFLPVLGDIIEGFWDGLIGNTADGPTDAYEVSYQIGAFIPDLIVTAWDFLTGFVQGFF